MTLGMGFAFALVSKAVDEKKVNELTFTPHYEQRERFERRTNKVFESTKDDNRSDLFTRVRPGVSFKYGNKISGDFTYQYAHDWHWMATGNASTDNSDLLLGYVSYKNGGGTTTVGRQRLKKGNERLIGQSDYGNISNSFDVVRYQGQKVDLFAGELGVQASESKNMRIYGGSYDWRAGETMVVGTHDIVKGLADDIVTVDQLYRPTFGRTHLDLEAAAQLGHKEDVQQRAWAVSGRVTQTLSSKLSCWVEANAASGGTTSDGTATAFNNLYPTNHGYYGIADMQGWSNMGEIAAEAGYKLKRELKLSAEYHHYWLHDATDGWYGNGGSINKIGSSSYISPTGAFGKDIGQEVSVEAMWDLDKNKQFSTGIADFMPGRFVESFVPAGTSIRQIWMYAQMNVKF